MEQAFRRSGRLWYSSIARMLIVHGIIDDQAMAYAILTTKKIVKPPQDSGRAGTTLW